jgi:hypothetical protein
MKLDGRGRILARRFLLKQMKIGPQGGPTRLLLKFERELQGFQIESLVEVSIKLVVFA